MKPCIKCKSKRILCVGNSTDSDRGYWSYGEHEHECTTLPYIKDVCGGEEVVMSFCLDCGQIQGEFPNNWEPEED